MLKKITCVGGSATGHYMAGLMAAKGFDVTLFDTEAYQANLDAVREKGGILLRGAMHCFGTPSLVTTCAEEAIRGAELISVHVMSDRHEEVARLIAPYLEDGQHILITPGNLGSFIFRRVFDEMHVTAKVTISEREGNLGPCRLTEPAEVTCGRPFTPKGFIASLPARDTPAVMNALQGIFDFSPNQNVLAGAMNAGNVIMHICSTILSATAIDRMGKEFSLFKWALTPATFSVMEQVQAERDRINDAVGYPNHKNMLFMAKRISQWEQHPEDRIFCSYMDGPCALDHRYLHEDCGCGAALALSIAKRVGVEAPVLTSLLVLAGTINGRNYIQDGRTLENLGFPAHMNMDEVHAAIE